MEFVAKYAKEIISVLVPIITWYLNATLKKNKLIWTSPHSFVFLINENMYDANGSLQQITKKVSTASIKVINRGKSTVNNVELVFNWAPQHINTWPIRQYAIHTDQMGRHFLTFENLAPNEEIGLEIMSVQNDLPALLQVRSAECVAENVLLTWYQPLPKWKLHLLRFIALIGMGALIYGAIVILQFLILKTPS